MFYLLYFFFPLHKWYTDFFVSEFGHLINLTHDWLASCVLCFVKCIVFCEWTCVCLFVSNSHLSGCAALSLSVCLSMCVCMCVCACALLCVSPQSTQHLQEKVKMPLRSSPPLWEFIPPRSYPSSDFNPYKARWIPPDWMTPIIVHWKNLYLFLLCVRSCDPAHVSVMGWLLLPFLALKEKSTLKHIILKYLAIMALICGMMQ